MERCQSKDFFSCRVSYCATSLTRGKTCISSQHGDFFSSISPSFLQQRCAPSLWHAGRAWELPLPQWNAIVAEHWYRHWLALPHHTVIASKRWCTFAALDPSKTVVKKKEVHKGGTSEHIVKENIEGKRPERDGEGKKGLSMLKKI